MLEFQNFKKSKINLTTISRDLSAPTTASGTKFRLETLVKNKVLIIISRPTLPHDYIERSQRTDHGIRHGISFRNFGQR